MLRLTAILLALCGVFASAGPLFADDAPDFATGGIPFLKQHCIECHSGKEPKAELALDVFPDSLSLVKQRKVWDNVLRMIVSGEMPPKAKPRPSVAESEKFTAHVKSVFDYADRNAKPNPGRVTMRRLNRQEYANTVRDLLGVDFNPTEDFPADDVGHGFDNIGDVLSLSPLLMERYLDAAETIANRVILVNPPRPASRYLSGRFLQPNNAQTSQGRFRQLNPTSPEPVHSGPFTAGGDYLKFSADADLMLRANLYAETKSPSPVKVALFLSGTGVTDASSDAEVEQLLGAGLMSLKPLKILKIFEITAREAKQTQQIEFPFNKLGNIQRAGIALVKPPAGEEPANLFIEHIWSEGPLETRPASHLKILACAPGQSPAQQTVEVLTRLLRRAYRRPATAEELARLVKLVETAQASGEKWEAGIQQAIQATLCSPKFLFRVELDDRPQSPDTQPLDEFQLASRLSYFLWSTLPDDELLDLAGKKELTQNLPAQVRRMLLDPKSTALVDNFALQWLQIKRLKSTSPDTGLFPQFNDSLRAAMLQESVLFFKSVRTEDRSILDLVDADYTFLNEPLARLYGIDDTNGNIKGQKVERPGGQPIRGEEFKRVSLQGKLRGGLLTQASVLTVTSNPTRTSPVKRGRWVLEQILGAPPPPPPPNVPELVDNKEAAAGSSLRERMELHRKNPSCANCHAKMDPIGFALENYNGIGEFRLKDGTFDIDPSGEFADGTRVKGPEDLKTLIRSKQELFARCLAEKMLIYALGRGLEYYDRPTIDKIVTALAAGDNKFSVLITQIVQSEPFRSRRGSHESSESKP
ncbi:MAG: hypothetical protein JWM11_4024 [Planctomycetaceae bacterium]|nr:hypothetical protein [Planctomycetaceae bacterium]